MKQCMLRIYYGMIVMVVLSVSANFSGLLAQDNLMVFVSISPQQYFVEQIGGDRVNVQVMVQPGASPHNYEPKPKQMADLSLAAVYFAIGVTYEDVWLKKIAAANPKMQVVYTQKDIEKIHLDAHSHGTDKGHKHHDHGILDPHIWLAPPLVKIQAGAILEALQELDPSYRDFYQTNYHEFMARIDELDADLKQLFAGKQGLRFMVFHPAWGYFARAYGLEQIPIEIEGKDPKPSHLKELIEHARKKGVRVIFVQPQFSARSAELIAKEIGGEVVLADPLSQAWLANLREVAEKFQAALK